jgi:ATP-dependent exoDNAse (exonuclease V) alpha subunit
VAPLETGRQLSHEQAYALERLKGTGNIFLTGEAGAGKSYVILEFRKGLDEKVFPTLASTGAAAVLVGGRTFHSFFGLGIMEGGAQATVTRALGDRRVVRRLQGIEGFIVDEVSMLSAETLAVAERICQMARDDYSPWGGVKAIVVGDFAQLPPVTKWGQQRIWAFESNAWKNSEFESIYLRENHRTGEADFLTTLNKVRMGIVDDETSEFLNSRLISEGEEAVFGTRLFPRVAQTQSYNEKRLSDLAGETTEFASIYSGRKTMVEKLKKLAPLPEKIVLKKDAYVMLRVNDPRKRWVNGTTGYIRSMKKDELGIELESGRVITIEKTTFSMLDAEGEVVAAVTNFPISLAYAITIHKAQGLTLSHLYVDLQGLWEPGHAYVALSRSTSAGGLNILRWNESSVKVDPKVKAFYSSLQADC